MDRNLVGVYPLWRIRKVNINNQSKLLIMALLLGTLSGSSVRGETIREVEAKLVQMWGQIESLRARIVATDDMYTREGNVKTRAVGTYEYLHKNGKRRSRTDVHSSTINYIKGLDARIEADIVSINDGQFVYTIADEVGTKSVTKTHPEPAKNFDVAQSLKLLRKEHELTLQDDELVEGEDVYVIKARSTNKKTFLDRSYHYYSKITGVLLKTTTFNNDDQMVSSVKFTDVEINVAIFEERFEFKAPEGIAVIDMTGGSKSK